MPRVSTLSLGRRTIEFFATSGEIVGEKKWTTTQVSGGGGGGYVHQGSGYVANAPVTSRTTTHDQIFLLSDDGEEILLQVSDVHLAVRQGHRVSLVWGIKKPKTDGPYIGVYNHNTKIRDQIDSGIRTLAATEYGLLWALGALGLAGFIGDGTALKLLADVALVVGLPIAAIVRYFRRYRRIAAQIDATLEAHINAPASAKSPAAAATPALSTPSAE